jgi:hypothetical protein
MVVEAVCWNYLTIMEKLVTEGAPIDLVVSIHHHVIDMVKLAFNVHKSNHHTKCYLPVA